MALRLGLNPSLLTVAFVFLAAVNSIPSSNRVVIDNDPGGAVLDRYYEIEHYITEKKIVEIRGSCYSACTMLLKIACVHPQAVLGFHGALENGQRTWSSDIVTTIMADYYPPRLQQWFMETAFELRGEEIAILTGAEAIALGARECK